MDLVKRLALVILSPLFIFLLFATAFDIGFVRTATHPDTVKKIAAESRIYDTVVPNLLKQAGAITTPYGDIAVSDPTVQQAAAKAVSPQKIRAQSDAAIDSIYQWLDGKISQPSFTLGLNGQNKTFADSVAGSIQQKLAGLPACSSAQNLAIEQGGQFDAVNATCLPRGFTATAIARQVKSAIAGNQAFLNQASISSANIKSGNTNQPVFDQSGVKNIPKQYQRAKKTPLILSILTVLTGAGIVFLSRTWQKGLRHVGINLVIIGIVMLVFSWTLNRAASTKIVPKISVDNAVLQQDIRHLVTDISQQIDKNYWFFGGLYTVLGAGGIAAAEVSLRRRAAAASSQPNYKVRPASEKDL